MSIVRWNPTAMPTFNRMIDNFLNTEYPEWNRRNFVAEGATLPAVNVKETTDNFMLEVAAPGLDRDHFTVEVEDGVLKIAATREMENEEKGEKYSRREFSYASFQRSFTLPDSVDGTQVSAKYVNGILEVTLPKRPEAKPQPVRRVEIG